MQVARIAHAGIVVKTRETTCIMDPLLVNRFESGNLRLEPAIRLNVEILRRTRFDAIILSHEHGDHFSLESLNMLSRETPVIFPKGCKDIPSCLAALGFSDLRPVAIGETMLIGDLELLATRSLAEFPEMGMVFRSLGRSRGQVCWNLVDTGVDAKIIREVLRKIRKVDLLLATYQPLIENDLISDALGASFPYDLYSSYVENVIRIAPACVVPSSFGFRNAVCEWINEREFPLTEERFLRDVQSAAKQKRMKLQTRSLRPGDAILVSPGFAKTSRALRFVSPASRPLKEDPRWRPDRGVPELLDSNPLRLTPRELREKARAYLDGEFLKSLSLLRESSWFRELRDTGVLWRLRIISPVGPGGPAGKGARCETRVLDFSRDRLSWQKELPGQFAQIQTSLTASGLVGMLTGQLTPNRVFQGDLIRNSFRVYAIQNGRLHRRWSKREDPIARVLGDTAAALSLKWQLMNLRR